METPAPDNALVLALDQAPLSSKIPFNPIEADHGRGDAPNSNDGMVAYSSSQLDGAESELIVSSGHAAQVHPVGIAEVRRILLSSHGHLSSELRTDSEYHLSRKYPHSTCLLGRPGLNSSARAK